MTPTGYQLRLRLDDRLRWLKNEWFFKWHHIKGDRPIKIDLFDGGFANYSGVSFEGSPHDVYWNAIVRGARREVVAQLEWLEERVRSYAKQPAEAALEECGVLLFSFVQSVRRTAMEKDAVLRGNGTTFPPEHDFGNWEGLSLEEISHQTSAIAKALFPTSSNVIDGKLSDDEPQPVVRRGNRAPGITTRELAQAFVREVYRRVGARRLQSVSMWDIGQALLLDRDKSHAICDYAADAGWVKHFAMGGSIVITSAGIDLAEESQDETMPAMSPQDIRITGSITNSIIQIAGHRATQNAAASAEAIEAARHAVEALNEAIKGINERTFEVEQLQADLNTAEEQLKSPSPRKAVLFQTLAAITENAMGSALGSVIVSLSPNLAALLERALQLLR
jgi:hypothetical protein